MTIGSRTITGACLFLAAAAAAAAPQLVIPKPVFDFGTIENKPVDVVFTLQNAGDAPLEITNIRPTCGCTVPDVKAITVAPGKSETLKASLELPKHVGEVHKAINITTNDPANPYVELKITGSLFPFIYPEPTAVSFQKLDATRPAEAAVKVRSMDASAPFAILEAAVVEGPKEQPSEFFTVSYEAAADGNGYDVKVSAQPPLPERFIPTKVVLKTDSARAAKVEIPISAMVIGPIKVSPAKIMLPQPRAGQAPITRTILVQPGLVESFQILDVSTNAPDVTFDVQFKENFGYTIAAKNIALSTELDGKEVVIKTDAPGREEVRIPFEIIAPRAVPRQPGR